MFVCFLTLSRYSSMFGEAVGGIQELFFLKGWGIEAGLFLKKNLSRLLLSNLSRDSDIGISGGAPLGTKVKPNERTSNWGGGGELSVLDERLVIYYIYC